MAEIALVDKNGNRVNLYGDICNPQPESVFAVQFSCGNCCKKVIGFNATSLLLDFLDDVVIFEAENFEILTFSGGRLVNKQMSTRQVRIVPATRFCIVEINSSELDPNNPINIGVSPLAVEVDCGGCCKKILNVNNMLESSVTTLLSPPQGELLYILTFNNGNLVSLESATLVDVLNSRMCSREENVTEIPIPKPVTRGVSLKTC